MTDRRHEMAQERIGRLLFRYSTPAMVAMFVNSTYNLVDAIFVGQGVGPLALAALAVTFPIQMIILATAQVVGIGSASIISRSLGAGNSRRADRVAGASFANTTVGAVALTVAGLWFLEPLLRLFGATEAVLPYAHDYMSVILGGCVFFSFAVSSNNVVRSEGNAKVAMSSMVIGAIVNLILDPVFIFGLGMGVRGAAIATVIGNVCSFTFLTAYFMSGNSILKIRLADLAPDLKTLPEVIAVGAPSFARVVAGSLFAIVLNHSIIHYGTELHLAVMGIANRVLMFMFLPLIGLVQGLQPILGFNYGARNNARVKEALWKGVAVGTTMALSGFAVLMCFPRAILMLFNTDATLLGEGVTILRILATMMPVIGFQTVGASLFQAIGKAFPALFLSMSRQVFFLIPLMIALPFFMRLTGVWLAFPISDLLSTFVTAVWVRREIRLLDRRG